MDPKLADALQALANQYNVILAVVETPEAPVSASQTFSPQQAQAPAASSDDSSAQ